MGWGSSFFVLWLKNLPLWQQKLTESAKNGAKLRIRAVGTMFVFLRMSRKDAQTNGN